MSGTPREFARQKSLAIRRIMEAVGCCFSVARDAVEAECRIRSLDGPPLLCDGRFVEVVVDE